jgi:LmbE family N-acetylglucosaminyl deacetylase
MKKVIVISAHPDDETLGAGGTILKHFDAGDEVFWIIATDVYENQGFSLKKIKLRFQEIEKVSKMYGFKKIYKLNYPTSSLSSSNLKTMIPEISSIMNEVKPEIVYMVNRSDAHSDHNIVFNATIACTKSFRYPYIKKVLMYECISETEFSPALNENVFIPNYFVNISDQIKRKIEIMKIYDSEIGNHPFPRSIENIKALAHFRGASSGFKFAEAFQLLKERLK